MPLMLDSACWGGRVALMFNWCENAIKLILNYYCFTRMKLFEFCGLNLFAMFVCKEDC
jgi:hypothetical protein